MSTINPAMQTPAGRRKRGTPLKRCLSLGLTLVLTLSMLLTSALALTKAPEAGTGTAHGVGLALVDSFPADGDTEIGFMPTIYCKFNHNICDANISPGNLACMSLVTADGTPVDVSTYVISPQVDFLMRQFLIMEPVVPLAPSTTYEVRLAPGIRARNGMATEQTFTFRFTTGAEDRIMGDPFEDSGSSGQPVTLELKETWPLADMKNVPLQTTMEFHFDHNVTGPDLVVDNLGHLSLTDQNGVPVEVVPSVDDSSSDFTQRQILCMKPAEPLLPNSTYIATVTAGVKSNNGASTTQDYTLTFTTESAPETEPVPADPDTPRPTPKPVPAAKPRETESVPTAVPSPSPAASQSPEVTESPASTAAPTEVPSATAKPIVPTESPVPDTQPEPVVPAAERSVGPVLISLLIAAAVILVLVLLWKRKH